MKKVRFFGKIFTFGDQQKLIAYYLCIGFEKVRCFDLKKRGAVGGLCLLSAYQILINSMSKIYLKPGQSFRKARAEWAQCHIFLTRKRFHDGSYFAYVDPAFRNYEPNNLTP